MTILVLDDLADLSDWRARRPTGSPSSEIGIAPGSESWLGLDTATVTATGSGGGHRLERALGPVDLHPFDDLQLWVRSERLATGAEASPFFLELRLGSSAATIGSPPNPWHRLIPVPVPGSWQPVTVSLDDLPPAVRGAVNRVRFTCLQTDVPFALDLGAIVAIREEMLRDLDEAIATRLGGRLQIDGAPVPAVHVPAAAAPPDPPFFRILNQAIRPVLERSSPSGTRTDYTQTGFSIRPPATVYDVLYRIEAVAEDRPTVAAMTEFVLAELAPVATLIANHRPHRVEWTQGPAESEGAAATPSAVHVKVTATQRSLGAPERGVPPFNEIAVEVDHRASA